MANVEFGNMYPYAFTTGACVRPLGINGRWMWVIERFEDDCFIDGQCRNFNETAHSEKELVDPEFEEEDDENTPYI